MGKHHIRRRARWFVAASTLAVLVAVASGAMVLIMGLGGFASHAADERARSGADLLTGIGPELPLLTRANLADPLSRAEIGRMDTVVADGQRERTLSDIQIWDRTGTVVYSVLARVGQRPALDADVVAALSGRAITRRHTSEIDLSTGKATGVLDAFEPLRDNRGVYGAVEVSLPLAPIVASTSQMQWRLVVVLVAGALVLWLLALPLVLRAARAAAEQWVPGRRRLLKAFAQALDQDEIEMAFQPQIEARSGEVRAVEALVRWRRDGELRPPDGFLPLVEASALMPALTDRVLDLSLAELCRCDAAGHHLRMSVNCSATDLCDPSLPARVRQALERHGIAGSRLTMEVTETAIFADMEAAVQDLRVITDLGVEIAVDDFGTGHASIARLQALPITELKIDRSFLSVEGGDYVTAIAAFGRSLGLRVVAEGVEDPAMLALLTRAGCDLAQGYYVSRPLAGDALRSWLVARELLGRRPLATVLEAQPVA
jgi:EAL domain-containing protein (putative c-di-GMP-specific phosphodiesterase class I)